MNTRTPNIVNQFTTGLYNGANGLMGNNPVLLLREGGIVKNNVIRATMAMALTYKILDGWNVSVQATPRYITKNNHNYKNSVTTYGDPKVLPASRAAKPTTRLQNRPIVTSTGTHRH